MDVAVQDRITYHYEALKIFEECMEEKGTPTLDEILERHDKLVKR